MAENTSTGTLGKQWQKILALVACPGRRYTKHNWPIVLSAILLFDAAVAVVSDGVCTGACIICH